MVATVTLSRLMFGSMINGLPDTRGCFCVADVVPCDRIAVRCPRALSFFL